MKLPLILSILATLAAAMMSYGVHPGWARFEWGVGFIMLTRRLQWPLIATAVILCLALVALVISGKRRVWWLIALGPVMALFVHRFLTAPVNRLAVLDEPTFVAASDAGAPSDDEYVVGVVFNEQAYAYPYSTLGRHPVVVQSDREKRMALMWSARANTASAVLVKRELKARHLDIVSDPRDSLLIYNRRSGQFVVSLTGMTRDGHKPVGFDDELPVSKTTWKHWRRRHPETRVLPPVSGPRAPAPMDVGDRVLLAGAPPWLALRDSDVTTTPVNAAAGDLPVVVVRDPSTGGLRAYDRRIEKDLIPQFASRRDPEKKSVFMVDSDTGTSWSVEGVAVAGDKKYRGHKLSPVMVQEDVYWPAVRFWSPRTKLLTK